MPHHLTRSQQRTRRERIKRKSARNGKGYSHGGYGPLGPMFVEKFIDGSCVLIRLETYPKLRKDRIRLENRIGLASFIRLHWDNITDLYQEGPYKSIEALCAEAVTLFGALAIGRIVIPDPSNPQDSLRRYKIVDPHMMLIFFEDEDAAMHTKMKYG